MFEPIIVVFNAKRNMENPTGEMFCLSCGFGSAFQKVVYIIKPSYHYPIQLIVMQMNIKREQGNLTVEWCHLSVTLALYDFFVCKLWPFK